MFNQPEPDIPFPWDPDPDDEDELKIIWQRLARLHTLTLYSRINQRLFWNLVNNMSKSAKTFLLKNETKMVQYF